MDPKNPEAPKPAASQPTTSPKRRWLRRVVVTLLVLIIVVAIGVPALVPKLARQPVLDAVGAQVNGRAGLETLSFSWPGTVKVGGFTIDDDRGDRVVAGGDVTASVGLLSILGGNFDLDVRIVNPEITVRQRPDGTLNISTLSKSAPPSPTAPTSQKPEGGGSGGGTPAPAPTPAPEQKVKLPQVKARFELAGGRVTYIANNGATARIEDIAAKATVDHLDQPLKFEASLRTGSGTARATGDLTIGHDGYLDIPGTHGQMSYAIDHIDFAAFEEVARGSAAIDHLAGRLNGNGAYNLVSLSEVKGHGEIKLEGLTISGGAIGAAPLAIQSIHWTDEFALDASGGRIATSLLVDQFAKSSSEVTLRSEGGKVRGIDAKQVQHVDLAGMAASLGGLMHLKPGFRIAGALDANSTVNAAMDNDGLRSADVVLNAIVDGLTVTDAAGKPLPVDRKMTVDVVAKQEPSGMARLVNASLRAGKVTAEAKGGYDTKKKLLEPSFLKADADLDDLAAKLGSFMDLGYAFGGHINIDSKLETAADLSKVISAVTVKGFRFSKTDGMKVGPLDLAMNETATLDATGSGKLTIDALALQAPGVNVSGGGVVTNFMAEGAAPVANLTLKGSVNPGQVTQAFGTVMQGYALGGDTITVDAVVGHAGQRSDVKGTLKAPRLEVTMPADPTAAAGTPASKARKVVQRDLTADYDVTQIATPGSESIELRGVRYASRMATASVTGRVSGKEMSDADLAVTADAVLAETVADLRDMVPPGYEARGKSHTTARLNGSGSRLKLVSATSIKDFAVSMLRDGSNEPVTVTDPEVGLNVDADVASDSGDVLINSCRVSSGFVNGGVTGQLLGLRKEPQFKGLKGDFTYMPDKLGAVLAPFLPGKMTGSTERKVSFTLDGRSKENDPISVLRGSTGHGAIGVAPFAMTGVDINGDITTDIKNEQLSLNSLLKLNGGDFNSNGLLDLRQQDDAKSAFSTTLSQAKANKEMSPLLAMVNPLFALDGGGSGLIQGLIDVKLDASYSGKITKDTLAGGWDALPKRGINAKGRIGFTDLAVQGSGLVSTLGSLLNGGGLGGLGALAGGNQPPQKMELAPVEFTIKDGRLSYDKPLDIAVAGFRTTWTGTIGLDKSLDLAVDLPVGDKMIAKSGFLKFWQGQSIRIPVKGTTNKPEMRIEGVFADLAKQAIQKELESRAGGAVGGALGGALGGVLGGKKDGGGQPAGGNQGGNGQPAGGNQGGNGGIPPLPDNPLSGLLGGGDAKKAADLLADADKQYAAGKKVEAAALYKKLRDKYPKTDAYKKNKERVDPRADGK